MAQVLQDSFTDTNGTVLSSHTSESGATYARHASFTVATITIEDNRAAKDTDVTTAVYYVNNITDPKFPEVEFTIIDKSDVNRSTGIEVGIDTGSDTAIIYRRQNATTWQLLTIIAGTPSATLLSASETFSAEAQHTLKLRRIPETNDYECFLDNVSLGVVAITDAEFLSAGKIGIRATNSQGAGVGYHLDNLSVRALTAPRTLHRGRHFSFFDDEELNRFEFWPAATSGATHERAIAVSATGDIASTGETFSVFERTAAIDAVGGVASAGLHVVERSASFDAAASISTAAQFFSILERAATVDCTATVAISGARVVDGSASFMAAASIETTGESFTVFESAASLNATASIESSGISFSVFERSASLSASASIEVAGLRIVERLSSLSVTATVESAGIFFSVLSSAVQIDATVAIETSAEFFSILERQVAIGASATITTARQVELARAASFSTVADIAVTGGIEGGIFEHERSVAISATGTIESAAISFSVVERASAITASASVVVSGLTVRERSASVSATATITTTAQRDLQRSASISATVGIESAGASGAEPIERAVTLSAAAAISVSATFLHPAPARRVYVVESTQRTVTVAPDIRIYLAQTEERTTPA